MNVVLQGLSFARRLCLIFIEWKRAHGASESTHSIYCSRRKLCGRCLVKGISPGAIDRQRVEGTVEIRYSVGITQCKNRQITVGDLLWFFNMNSSIVYRKSLTSKNFRIDPRVIAPQRKNHLWTDTDTVCIAYIDGSIKTRHRMFSRIASLRSYLTSARRVAVYRFGYTRPGDIRWKI